MAPSLQLKVASETGSAAQQWVSTAHLHHQRAVETDRETGKCVRTMAGWKQAGSKRKYQHAKNAFRHA